MPSVLKIILVLASLMLLTACQTDRRRCETETGGAATYRKSDNCGRAAKPAEGSDRPERQVREKQARRRPGSTARSTGSSA
jgi:hypothetical protein